MDSARRCGDYVLLRQIGRGGMSRVFEAAAKDGASVVAVKILDADLASDAREVERFLAEAERTREIDHPSVVRVHESGRSDDGALYIAMERVNGESLRARMRREGPLPEAEVRRIGAAIADGLAAAHDRGIAHRDLKPGNVLLPDDGPPKVIDFGIAKRWAAGESATRRIGTVEYMAPEQITGGPVGPAIDVFALGVVLFELLAGRLPFEGYAEGTYPALFQAPQRVGRWARVSPALERLVDECLARNPSQRPSSMRELAARLRAPAAGDAVSALDPERATASVDAPAPKAPIEAPAATRPLRPPRHPSRKRDGGAPERVTSDAAPTSEPASAGAARRGPGPRLIVAAAALVGLGALVGASLRASPRSAPSVRPPATAGTALPAVAVAAPSTTSPPRAPAPATSPSPRSQPTAAAPRPSRPHRPAVRAPSRGRSPVYQEGLD